jgi:hypothetical protein
VRRTTSLSHIKISEASDESKDQEVVYTQIISEKEAEEMYPKGLRKNSSQLSLLSLSNMSNSNSMNGGFFKSKGSFISSNKRLSFSSKIDSHRFY